MNNVNNLKEIQNAWFRSVTDKFYSAINIKIENVEFLQFRKFMELAIDALHKENYEINERWLRLFCEPIFVENNAEIALKNIIENKITILNEIIQVSKAKNHNPYYYTKIFDCFNALRNKISELISSEFFEIKIEIIEKPHVQAKVINEYESVRKLFLENNFEKALQHCRDIFQKDLEETFKLDIKNFIDKKSSELNIKIADMIEAISKVRHLLKTTSLNGYSQNEKMAITKLAIEQLINTRNFIATLHYND